MSFEDRFAGWREELEKELPQIFLKASQPLPEEPEEMIKSLCTVEAYYARLGSFLSEIDVFLDQGARLYLPDKETGMSELDRKTTMKSDLAVIQSYHNKIESLLDSVKQKIILGESILRYQSMFMDRKVKEPEKIW